jgi:ATP synthase F1 delta subunit
MSFSKKIVTTYCKSLLQNNQHSSATTTFDLNNLSVKQTGIILADLNVIGEELLVIKSFILSSKSTKEFFKNPTYPESQKLNLIVGIFPGLTSSTKSFLRILTEKSHLALIPEIYEQYTETLLKFRSSTKVNLLIAAALNRRSGKALLETLRFLTTYKNILLNVSYKPKLLGGLIVEYNSLSIDASLLKEFGLFFTGI